MCCPQVSLAALTHPVNRSCSHYITLMATFLWSWTSSQVVMVTLYTHVPTTDQSLETDTTCSFITTPQASATPSPVVATPTPCPLGTLHLGLPVNFMQDPTNSLPLMLKCSMRKQHKALYLLTQPTFMAQIWQEESDQLTAFIWKSSLLLNCPCIFSNTVSNPNTVEITDKKRRFDRYSVIFKKVKKLKELAYIYVRCKNMLRTIRNVWKW